MRNKKNLYDYAEIAYNTMYKELWGKEPSPHFSDLTQGEKCALFETVLALYNEFLYNEFLSEKEEGKEEKERVEKHTFYFVSVLDVYRDTNNLPEKYWYKKSSTMLNLQPAYDFVKKMLEDNKKEKDNNKIFGYRITKETVTRQILEEKVFSKENE